MRFVLLHGMGFVGETKIPLEPGTLAEDLLCFANTSAQFWKAVTLSSARISVLAYTKQASEHAQQTALCA